MLKKCFCQERCGCNFTILDSNVWGNVTFDDLKQDAEKALHVLIQQAEVDPGRVSIVGYSEGTTIAPRVAIDNPEKVDNIVVMGSVAQNLRPLLYFQKVTKPVLYAQQVLDHNHNGLISVQEASDISSILSPTNLTLILTQNVTSANGTAKQLNPQYNTNNDIFIGINDELKPKLIEYLKSLSVVTPGEKCTDICPIWLASHYSLIPTLDIIDKVPSDTSILIQQGKNDSQAKYSKHFFYSKN
jgi:uncharacterized protein